MTSFIKVLRTMIIFHLCFIQLCEYASEHLHSRQLIIFSLLFSLLLSVYLSLSLDLWKRTLKISLNMWTFSKAASKNLHFLGYMNDGKKNYNIVCLDNADNSCIVLLAPPGKTAITTSFYDWWSWSRKDCDTGWSDFSLPINLI